jgi:hypothetical protein
MRIAFTGASPVFLMSGMSFCTATSCTNDIQYQRLRVCTNVLNIYISYIDGKHLYKSSSPFIPYPPVPTSKRKYCSNHLNIHVASLLPRTTETVITVHVWSLQIPSQVRNQRKRKRQHLLPLPYKSMRHSQSSLIHPLWYVPPIHNLWRVYPQAQVWPISGDTLSIALNLACAIQR